MIFDKEIIHIPIEEMTPEAQGVYLQQGIPLDITPSERVQRLYHEAETLFMQLVAPICMLSDVDTDSFRAIYAGNGLNERETPLEAIYPCATHLALFSATMGSVVSDKVETLMKNKGTDFALGFMLDSVASFCADKAARFAETLLLKRLIQGNKNPPLLKVLLYSPGYCGWHVSGQGKLFEYLKPQEIGITLNQSYLMTPIKSISGVLVAGSPQIHCFDNDFTFCDQCRTHNCRERQDI